MPTSVLRTRAREMGMRTLREDGIRKVLAGLTTPEEVIRATVGDEAELELRLIDFMSYSMSDLLQLVVSEGRPTCTSAWASRR